MPRLGDPGRELAAAREACAVAERPDLARLIATGPDLLGLLHRLSTGEVAGLEPGQGRPTVVTSAKGRIVASLTAHRLEDRGVLLLAGAGSGPALLAHLRKYTFSEDTGLADVTATTFAFTLFGPAWALAARGLGLPDLPDYGAARLSFETIPVDVVRTSGFDAEGLTFVGQLEGTEPVGRALSGAAEREGGGGVGPETLEAWRVLQGHPAAGRELTEDVNPLEAGLRDAVSFTKGCYVGQEVIARLNTYDKVSRKLVRLSLDPGPGVPRPGSAVVREGRAIGAVTSAVLPAGADRPVALALVKIRELPSDGSPLAVDEGGSLRRAAIR